MKGRYKLWIILTFIAILSISTVYLRETLYIVGGTIGTIVLIINSLTLIGAPWWSEYGSYEYRGGVKKYNIYNIPLKEYYSFKDHFLFRLIVLSMFIGHIIIAARYMNHWADKNM